MASSGSKGVSRRMRFARWPKTFSFATGDASTYFNRIRSAHCCVTLCHIVTPHYSPGASVNWRWAGVQRIYEQLRAMRGDEAMAKSREEMIERLRGWSARALHEAQYA